MFSYLHGILINCIYYLKTHRPFGAAPKRIPPNYENLPAINRLIANHGEATRIWLELLYQHSSVERV